MSPKRKPWVIAKIHLSGQKRICTFYFSQVSRFLRDKEVVFEYHCRTRASRSWCSEAPTGRVFEDEAVEGVEAVIVGSHCIKNVEPHTEARGNV